MYYAVKKGKNPGIYSEWNECKKQINDFKYPLFRVFNQYETAKCYMNDVYEGKIFVVTDQVDSKNSLGFAFAVDLPSSEAYVQKYNFIHSIASTTTELIAFVEAIEFCLTKEIKSVSCYCSEEMYKRLFQQKKENDKKLMIDYIFLSFVKDTFKNIAIKFEKYKREKDSKAINNTLQQYLSISRKAKHIRNKKNFEATIIDRNGPLTKTGSELFNTNCSRKAEYNSEQLDLTCTYLKQYEPLSFIFLEKEISVSSWASLSRALLTEIAQNHPIRLSNILSKDEINKGGRLFNKDKSQMRQSFLLKRTNYYFDASFGFSDIRNVIINILLYLDYNPKEVVLKVRKKNIKK